MYLTKLFVLVSAALGAVAQYDDFQFYNSENEAVVGYLSLPKNSMLIALVVLHNAGIRLCAPKRWDTTTRVPDSRV